MATHELQAPRPEEITKLFEADYREVTILADGTVKSSDSVTSEDDVAARTLKTRRTWY